MRQEPIVYASQFCFQRRHVQGKILNVGSNNDVAGFRAMGGINVDIHTADLHTGERNPVQALADARALPFKRSFDTVLLGEILEHMNREDGVRALVQARQALKKCGRVVITLPHEHREPPDLPEDKQFYAPGIYTFHYRNISREEFFGWVKGAGLEVILWAKILYQWGTEGSGVIAC